MSGKRIVAILLTAVAATVSGAAGAVSAPARQTVRINPIGVAFDLPRGYVAVQSDLTEGPWATIISFGKELRPGHVAGIPLRLVLWPGAYDGDKTITQHSPSQFVEVEFQRVMASVRRHEPGFGWEPEYVKLFGNKAVRYTVAGLGGDTIILGFLRRSQLPRDFTSFTDEYGVWIAFSATEGPEFNRLVETVIASLRIIR